MPLKTRLGSPDPLHATRGPRCEGISLNQYINNISGGAIWWLIQRLSATTQHFAVRALSR